MKLLLILYAPQCGDCVGDIHLYLESHWTQINGKNRFLCCSLPYRANNTSYALPTKCLKALRNPAASASATVIA